MGFLIFGGILLIAGIVLFFVQKDHRTKAHSLKVARAVTVAELETLSKEIAQEIGGGNWRDYVKLTGTVVCDRPITSELTQTPCVHYSMNVRREHEETVTRKDSNGNETRETQRGSETVSSNQQSVPFELHDATGAIAIEPTDADIETVKVLDEFRRETAGNFISFGGFSLALSSSGSGRRTLGYRYCESILPLDRRITVVAALSDSTSRLTLQSPAASDKKFIISLRSEEELTKAADRNTRLTMIAMIACLILGVIFLIVGLVVR